MAYLLAVQTHNSVRTNYGARLMAPKAANQNPEANQKRWARPELKPLGTIADVAAANPNKASSNIQGNFT